MAAAAPALARAVFVPMARDRATAVVAAVALAALAAVPWSGISGPSALLRAVAGEALFWPLLGASVATLLFAAWGRDALTAGAAALASRQLGSAQLRATPSSTTPKALHAVRA